MKINKLILPLLGLTTVGNTQAPDCNLIYVRRANSNNNSFTSCLSSLDYVSFYLIGAVDRGENDKNCGKYWINQTGDNPSNFCSRIDSDLGLWGGICLGIGGDCSNSSASYPDMAIDTSGDYGSPKDCFAFVHSDIPGINNFSLLDDTFGEKGVLGPKVKMYDPASNFPVLYVDTKNNSYPNDDVTFEWGNCPQSQNDISVTNDEATQAYIEIPPKK